MSRIESLEQEIQRLKDKTKMLENWQSKIRTLDSFTPEEKIRYFDFMHNRVMIYLEELIKTGYEPKDAEHHLYEMIVSHTLGSNVWNIINAMI